MTFSFFPFYNDSFIPSLLPPADPQGRASDLVPGEAFQLAQTHHHCILSHLLGQPSCYLRALYPRHFWPHRYVNMGLIWTSRHYIICV